MKYMLIMRATDEAYAAFQGVDFDKIIESMGRFNDEMISAGVLVAAEDVREKQRLDAVAPHDAEQRVVVGHELLAVHGPAEMELPEGLRRDLAELGAGPVHEHPLQAPVSGANTEGAHGRPGGRIHR